MSSTQQSCNLQSPVWIAGQVLSALSLMAVFISISIHVGTKKSRQRMPVHVKEGLFTLAQCSAVAVAAFGDSPPLGAFIAAALTQQFGTEPYWAMAIDAVQTLLRRDKNEEELKKVQEAVGSPSPPSTEAMLKFMLVVGVFFHHFSIILLPLVMNCIGSADNRDLFPFFLSAIVLLGCIAGVCKNNLVRAATDVFALMLYWIGLYSIVDQDSWEKSVVALVWVVMATCGDVVIGCQLILWHFLIEKQALKNGKRTTTTSFRTVAVETNELWDATTAFEWDDETGSV